jgi:hypothetical protein
MDVSKFIGTWMAIVTTQRNEVPKTQAFDIETGREKLIQQATSVLAQLNAMEGQDQPLSQVRVHECMQSLRGIERVLRSVDELRDSSRQITQGNFGEVLQDCVGPKPSN